MFQCLRDLDEQLRARGSGLVVRRGNPREVVPLVAREAGVELGDLEPRLQRLCKAA